jgi:hypothetical protein
MVEKAQPTEAAGSVKRGAEPETASPPRSAEPDKQPRVSPQDEPAAKSTRPIHAAAPLADELIAVAHDATAPGAIAERAKVLVDDFNTRTRAVLDKSAKIGEELSDVAKGNVEAIVASSHAVAEGAETLGRQAADYRKRRAEKAAAALSSLAAARTPAELLDVQSDYVRGSVNDAMAQTSLFGDLWARTARDAVEPLSSRYAVAAEKMLIVVR